MKRIVVIGASAGGIEVLRTLLAALPKDFPAPIVIVVHTSPQSPGVLDQIFDRAGVLTARHASDRERIRNGHVYVAPPDHHVLVEPGVLRLTRGPRENRFRPAVDPLFRSAAQVYGPGAIGVVLSGNLDDGTAGLAAIKQLGGTAIVQDPADAPYPSMPLSALRHVKVDYSVPVSSLGPLLVELASMTAQELEVAGVPEPIDVELRIAKEHNPLAAGLGRIASPSQYTCPECHGVLLEVTDSELPRFRCHTGHAYSAGALLASVDEAIDRSLWSSVRVLEEGALLASRLAAQAREHADLPAARYLDEEARRLTEQMETVRAMVRSRDTVIADTGTGS